MNKDNLKQIISECIGEVIQESKQVDEFNFQKLQQKVGKFIGNKSLARGKGGYGAKIDKFFKTKGHQQRSGQLDKANIKRVLQTIELNTKTLLNVVRGVAVENPTTVVNFSKEFITLLKKYNLDKSNVQPSESV